MPAKELKLRLVLMLLLFTLRLTSLVSVAVTQAGLQESFGASLVRRYWSSVRANQTTRCSGMILNLLGYVCKCIIVHAEIKQNRQKVHKVCDSCMHGHKVVSAYMYAVYCVLQVAFRL